MIYRVQIKNKEGYTTFLLVEAKDIADASVKVIEEYPEHMITSVTEDVAEAIIR